MYFREAFLVRLYLILKISHYVEFASLLEIYTFLTYKKGLQIMQPLLQHFILIHNRYKVSTNFFNGAVVNNNLICIFFI